MKVVTVVGMLGHGEIPDYIPANEASSKVRIEGQLETPCVFVKSRWGTMAFKDCFPFRSEPAIPKPCLDGSEVGEDEGG
jgi:hypothetical protein